MRHSVHGGWQQQNRVSEDKKIIICISDNFNYLESLYKKKRHIGEKSIFLEGTYIICIKNGILRTEASESSNTERR